MISEVTQAGITHYILRKHGFVATFRFGIMLSTDYKAETLLDQNTYHNKLTIIYMSPNYFSLTELDPKVTVFHSG